MWSWTTNPGRDTASMPCPARGCLRSSDPGLPPVIPSGVASGHPTRQETLGVVQFPLAITVKPKELPAPLGLAVITVALDQLALVFQVELIRWEPARVTVTIHRVFPETVT